MYTLYLQLIGQPFKQQSQTNRCMTVFNMHSVPETVLTDLHEGASYKCRLHPCTFLADIKMLRFGAVTPAGVGADLHDESVYSVCVCNRICA